MEAPGIVRRFGDGWTESAIWTQHGETVLCKCWVWWMVAREDCHRVANLCKMFQDEAWQDCEDREVWDTADSALYQLE